MAEPDTVSSDVVAENAPPDTVSNDVSLRTEYMLTTYDNPFDPWTEFEAWFQWDEAAGYHTAGLLARIAFSSPDIGEGDQQLAIQEAIEEIVRENVRGIYQKIAQGQHEKFGTMVLPEPTS